MGWHRSDEDARADHYRDERKHEPRPDDPPHRLDRKISTAEDIALCVRALRNLSEGAALIEQYAQMVASIAVAEQAERRVLGKASDAKA